MNTWQDITTLLIVGAAAVYCGAQVLMIGRKRAGGGSACGKGCNACPANRADSLSGSGASPTTLIQISRPGNE